MLAILLGSPGSGKGTQSQRLTGKVGLQHLATGDMFRSEITQHSALGIKAQDYVKAGKLVPDAIVTEMVAARLDSKGDYLLDGFPRNIIQAQSLADILKRNGTAIDLVLYLSLPSAEAIRRMSSRRICSQCAEVYNTVSRPMLKDGVCDKCGGAVIQREDDTEATAAKRLMVYNDLTEPLVAYYKAEHVFHEIDALQPADKVEATLTDIIQSVRAAR